MSENTPTILWNPSSEWIENTHLNQYRLWLSLEKGLRFHTYDELWAWSVDDTRLFWETIYEYFQVIDHGRYTHVHGDEIMPDTSWFPGSAINYAEHVFRSFTNEYPAIVFQSETTAAVEIGWAELHQRVAALAAFLRAKGIRKGDRVAAFIANTPEATIGFLAACSIGAIWSSCSPDFGAHSVVDRFQQIAPKVLIAVGGYQYGGKGFDKRGTLQEIVEHLHSLELIIEIPYMEGRTTIERSYSWSEVTSSLDEPKMEFEPVEFEHPIWVLYSSGTTGKPKAITHGHGGVLLEHLKYVSFHNDVKPGERYFWFTTTGWMMWNFVQATLLAGATIVLYDGSPGYPDLEVLWAFAQDQKINHFGTSAPFILACLKAKVEPAQRYDLKHLRSLSSTGSPLPPEAFDWIYQHVKSDLWVCSMSGGTDVCSAFVGGCPVEPVYEGEIQCRALGCAMYAYDDDGQSVVNEVGEMVIVKPMPSMPVFFWNDPDKLRYRESYFEMFPGIWRHGDWLEITTRHTLMIKGRSDATLNRHGVRIGTAEVYQSVDKIAQIRDSLVVNLEQEGGKHFMPLFVVMTEGVPLTDEIQRKIGDQLKNDFSPRHVPDAILVVPEIPYTISGKKMEAPVKKILMGKAVEKAANMGAMKNPESLAYFAELAKTL